MVCKAASGGVPRTNGANRAAVSIKRGRGKDGSAIGYGDLAPLTIIINFERKCKLGFDPLINIIGLFNNNNKPHSAKHNHFNCYSNIDPGYHEIMIVDVFPF